MYYVYILANATNVAIYTGVTRDLILRVAQHRAHHDPNSYTARYHITKLVYFETTPSISSAIEREKEAAGKMPSHAMYEDLTAKVHDALNALYSQGRIKVGRTINSKYITTKTGHGQGDK